MKKMRILIITLIVILVLGGATFATLYFATDIFKSNKEIFCKYIAQMNLAELGDDNRLKNETNSSKGNFSFRLETEGETIDEGFEYSSESDPANKLASAKINIKQDGENKLIVDYLRNEDLYGLRFEDIITQYIVVENNNLKEFAEKLRLEREIIEAIPDKIEIKDSEFINQEELKQIYSRYINIVLEQTPDENYSKVGKESITVGSETIEADGYMLSINSADLKRILIAMLNTAENDEQIFNLISKINQEESNQITFEEYKETIEMIRDELLEEEIEENSLNLNITVYKQGKNVVKVYSRISVPDEEKSYIDFSIDKVKDDEIELKANIVMDEATLSINFSKNGNSNSKNIQTNASIEFKEEEGSIKIEYSNNTEFGTNVDIEKFDSKNHAVINNLEGDQISNLVVNLSNKIYEKIDREKTIFGTIITGNKNLFNKAEQAVIETTKQTDKEILLMKAIEALDNNGTVKFEILDENLPEGFTGNNGKYISENGNAFSVSSSGNIEEIDKTQITLQNTIEQEQNSMQDMAKEMFNNQFSFYEGGQIGANVKMLISTIETSKLNNPDHIIEYNNLNIDNSKRYQVSFEKDENGYINGVSIHEE